MHGVLTDLDLSDFETLLISGRCLYFSVAAVVEILNIWLNQDEVRD